MKKLLIATGLVGYTAKLIVIGNKGAIVASTGLISVGMTKCVKGAEFCDDSYIYHKSTSHGEAWYKMWGSIAYSSCGRAG